MNALFSNKTVSVTLVKHSIELLGDFAGIGLDIAAGTRITTREPAERIIVSVVTPTRAMLDSILPGAANPVQNVSGGTPSVNLSGPDQSLLAFPIYLFPSGAIFDPPVTIRYRFSPSSAAAAREGMTPPQP